MKCPSKKFDKIKARLAEISSIAEEEDEFNIWDGSIYLVGCMSDGVIQAFVCVIDTDSYFRRREERDKR